MRFSYQSKFILLLSLISALFLGITIFFMNSPWGNELRERAVAPLEFKLRILAKQEPPISPRLKVIVFGDKAKRELGLQELITLTQWQNFIVAIASRSPRAIIFDKFFSISQGNTEEINRFNETLSSLSTPVIAASAFGNIPTSEEHSQVSQFSSLQIDDLNHIERGEFQKLIGPAFPIRSAFKKIGIIMLSNTSAVHPAWLETSSQSIIPHISLSFASKITMTERRLRVDDSLLYLDKYNRIPVNFISRAKAFENFLPAAPLFRLGSAAPVLQKIHPEDVVLVLPSMYAGSTDMKDAPIGRLEGGLFHMAVMNSVLENRPLRPILQNFFEYAGILFLLSVFSLTLVVRFKIKVSILILLLTTVIISGAGIVGFIYASILSDWHVFSAFLLFNGGTSLALRAIRDERQSERVESALEGMVSPAVLKTIQQRPDVLYRRPNEQMLTVMFVDIEGFSHRIKDLLSVDVFHILHAQIGAISQIIHSHGGVIDRILGDGLMCFFGFSFEQSQNHNQQSNVDHAERALRCAIEIQRKAVRLTAGTTDAQSIKASLLPLRIGLSSGEAFLGNLGAGKRIDFTIVGDTVNMAKRYEDACEVFRVFMSPATYERIQNRNLLNQFSDVEFRPRHMALKHHSDLSLGWECDPHFKKMEPYLRAVANLRPGPKETSAQTLNFTHETLSVCINESDVGQVTEMSLDVFTIVTDVYYCRKVFLSVELKSSDKDLDAKLAAENLKTISMQVTSGSPCAEGGFIHTVTLAHVSPQKSKLLSSILEAALAR